MVLTNRLLNLESDGSTVLAETEYLDLQSLDITADIDVSGGRATLKVNPKVVRLHSIPMAIALG